MSAVKATKSSPLGRGLSALFGDQDNSYLAPEMSRAPKSVPIEFLYPGKYQPRQHFDDEAIQGLADSIKEKGVLQPLLVRRHPSIADAFEIIAGERRWRASQKAGLHELPVIVRELSDRETLEIGLIENIQRQDLNPLDEAEGYQRLMNEFGHTQEALSKSVGKSRSHVANMLRLLSLPASVKDLVKNGDLSMTHARALLSVANPELVAKEIVTKGLNVRAVEIIAKQEKEKTRPAAAVKDNSPNTTTPDNNPNTTIATGLPKDADVDLLALEAEVASWLGLAVRMQSLANGSGSLTISYHTLDQLEDVLKRLATAPRLAI